MRNQVTVAETGDRALELLRDPPSGVRFDLVLLDVNLPGRSGIEILEELKSDPDLEHLPLVILTTSKEEQDIARGYQLRAASS